jgi:hypothetical protein
MRKGAARSPLPRRTRPGQRPSSPPPSQGQERVIGRSVELAQLRGALREAAAGQGQIVLVSGEPGIGKTRLVEELAANAASFGIQACWSRCWQDESTPPFWPWVQLIRQSGRTTSPADLSAQLEALGIRYLLPELLNDAADAPAPAQPRDQDRFWLFDAITRFFAQAAVARPLLLILEDVHWSDAASMLLLRFLARQLRDSAIRIVGTYRDTEVVGEHPVGRLAAELTSENQRCYVAGLSQSTDGRQPTLRARACAVKRGSRRPRAAIARQAASRRWSAGPDSASPLEAVDTVSRFASRRFGHWACLQCHPPGPTSQLIARRRARAG